MKPPLVMLGALALMFAIFVVLNRPQPGDAPAGSEPSPSSAPSRVEPLNRREIQLDGARGLVLSVREPVTTEQVQSLIDSQRDAEFLVRVFTYRDGAVPQRDQPAALYEWTAADGLTRKY